jgi:hypothetical protein
MRPISFAVLLFALPACAARAQQKPELPTPLATEGLAGQTVTVLPLTMAVTDPRLPGTGPASRAATLAWADSLIADMLLERAPEVTWMLPAELRRIAERAPGMIPSPDKMGQSVMRNPRMNSVPDPLRGYLRHLVGMAGGGRYALIPAAMTLTPAGVDSLEVTLSAILADGRMGTVLWRTRAVGRGETAADAMRIALATIVPVEP